MIKSPKTKRLTKSEKIEQQQSPLFSCNITQLLRLLTIAALNIVPYADKFDARAGIENCPANSVDIFIDTILPLLDKGETSKEEIQKAILNYHSTLKAADIPKVWLQVIKMCFSHIQLLNLEDKRTEIDRNHVIEMIQGYIKEQLQQTNGNWQESLRKYRTSPIDFFKSVPYEAIQKPFYAFILTLKLSGNSASAEAIHQYLRFLKQIGLKRQKEDSASDDENLFGIAFNAVPAILNALHLKGNIYTETFIKNLKLSKTQKPSIDDAERIEYFFFKNILFALLKASVLDHDFDHADYSLYAEKDQEISSNDLKKPISVFQHKLASLREYRKNRRQLELGAPELIDVFDKSNSLSKLSGLEEVHKELLRMYHKQLSNSKLKDTVEDLDLSGLSVNDPETHESDSINTTQTTTSEPVENKKKAALK